MTPAILIRVALLVGVLLFGALTWYIRRDAPATGMDPEALHTLLWVGRGTWIVSMATCIAIFNMLRTARSASRVSALSLVGWAAGEAVALVGGVIWFLTGITQWYSAGLVYLVLTFLAFPARRA